MGVRQYLSPNCPCPCSSMAEHCLGKAAAGSSILPGGSHALNWPARIQSVKRCGSCGAEKPLTEFHRRGAGYQSLCKECRKVLDEERYRTNPQQHAMRQARRKKKLTDWMRSLKEGVPCVDCQVSYHPVAMQWDHVRGEKVGAVSAMTADGRSRAAILSEISKCDLVCANCHAVRTYKRQQNLAE